MGYGELDKFIGSHPYLLGVSVAVITLWTYVCIKKSCNQNPFSYCDKDCDAVWFGCVKRQQDEKHNSIMNRILKEEQVRKNMEEKSKLYSNSPYPVKTLKTVLEVLTDERRSIIFAVDTVSNKPEKYKLGETGYAVNCGMNQGVRHTCEMHGRKSISALESFIVDPAHERYFVLRENVVYNPIVFCNSLIKLQPKQYFLREQTGKHPLSDELDKFLPSDTYLYEGTIEQIIQEVKGNKE